MIVVLVCVILQCLKGNLLFKTLILRAYKNTVFINVQPSAMYVYVFY